MMAGAKIVAIGAQEMTAGKEDTAAGAEGRGEATAGSGRMEDATAGGPPSRLLHSLGTE